MKPGSLKISVSEMKTDWFRVIQFFSSVTPQALNETELSVSESTTEVVKDVHYNFFLFVILM
jgi:hypothetical protein